MSLGITGIEDEVLWLSLDLSEYKVFEKVGVQAAGQCFEETFASNEGQFYRVVKIPLVDRWNMFLVILRPTKAEFEDLKSDHTQLAKH